MGIDTRFPVIKKRRPFSCIVVIFFGNKEDETSLLSFSRIITACFVISVVFFSLVFVLNESWRESVYVDFLYKREMTMNCFQTVCRAQNASFVFCHFFTIWQITPLGKGSFLSSIAVDGPFFFLLKCLHSLYEGVKFSFFDHFFMFFFCSWISK